MLHLHHFLPHGAKLWFDIGLEVIGLSCPKNEGNNNTILYEPVTFSYRLDREPAKAPSRPAIQPLVRAKL